MSSARESYDRSKCTLEQKQCEELLKEHVDDLQNKKYKQEDMDLVVSFYRNFLMACALLTSRLTKTVVSKAAKAVFNASSQVCGDFGEAMTKALAHCRSKGSQATTGAKIHRDVMKVFNCFPDKHIKSSSDDHAKDANKVTEASCSVALPVKSNKKDTADSPRRSIYAAYGVEPPKKAPIESIDVLSPQEVAASQSPSKKPSEPLVETTAEASAAPATTPKPSALVSVFFYAKK